MVTDISIQSRGESPQKKSYHFVKPGKAGRGLQMQEALAVLLVLVYDWVTCRAKLKIRIEIDTSDHEFSEVDKLTAAGIIPPPTPKDVEKLSDTERSVMLLTARGLKQSDIAAINHITPAGVKQCRHRIYPKLHIKSSVSSIVRYVIDHGWQR